MDHAAFHVVYVDKRVSASLDGQYLHDVTRHLPAEKDSALPADQQSHCFQQISLENAVVRDNLGILVSSFNGVHICTSGHSCMATLLDLESNETNLQPTLVILESATALDAQQTDDRISARYQQSNPNVQSAMSTPSTAGHLSTIQDSSLIRTIASRITSKSLSDLVVPLVLIQSPENDTHPGRQQNSQQALARNGPLVPQEMLQCMDEGAADVFYGPLALDRIRSIASHAYRVRKDKSKQRALFHEAKKARKRSWVGIDDRKPYAYLREQMVSGLMTGICSPHDAQPMISYSALDVNVGDDPALVRAFTSWEFSAHEFSEDQLVQAAFLMLQHALNMAELERWRLPAADLKSFLMASRAAYNSFVHYHNFRHVIDVMQAVFYFLLRIGTLPPYPQGDLQTQAPTQPESPIGSLLQPFDALTLLISAIGHDVGHPGVNNAFLVALNAPLAQLYNDKSVLESFHCAAYSQILRRYWRSAFEDTGMRGLMINSILATDMGLHFKYMVDLGNLQEKVYHNKGTKGWSSQVLDEYRTLTCGLLIKCADISNVARPFNIAAIWADILQLEFANQGAMENDLGMATTLFGGPPELGNLTKLANSQSGFMNIFACPLFEAVADILPGMAFAIQEMKINQDIWKKRVQEQYSSNKKKQSISSESFLSPRSGSPSRSSSQPEFSHPEGLPASQVSSAILTSTNASTGAEKEEPRRASAVPLLLSSSDPLGQKYPQDSRRSSLNAQPGHSSSLTDPASSSRRSSGGFLAGQSIPASLATRRPSATSPSQLQLMVGSDSASHTYSTTSAAENVQPSRRDSEGTQTNDSTVTSDTGSRNVPTVSSGGNSARKGSKSSDGNQTLNQQHSMAYAMARHSPYSTHERHSSGGHTSRSQSVPYSPTETQATSVTEDSDDRSQRLRERGGSSTIEEGVPEVVDMEKPGSGHRLTGSGMLGHSKGPDVKTTVVNGGSGGHHSNNGRLVTRKSSRFLNFWKKRGKATEPTS